MKRSITLILLFTAIFCFSNEITLDVFNVGGTYIGWDKYKHHKSATFDNAGKSEEIDYYIFSAGRFREGDSSNLDSGMSSSSADSQFLPGYSQDADFEADNYSDQLKEAEILPDHIYEGMIVINKKGLLVYFRGREVLTDHPEQMREVKIHWDPVSKLYRYTIWDPNAPESEQTINGDIGEGEMLPILTNLPAFFSIYEKAPQANKSGEISFIDPYKKEMIIVDKVMASKTSMTLDKTIVHEPRGNTRFYPLDISILDTTITPEEATTDTRYMLKARRR